MVLKVQYHKTCTGEQIVFIVNMALNMLPGYTGFLQTEDSQSCL